MSASKLERNEFQSKIRQVSSFKRKQDTTMSSTCTRLRPILICRDVQAMLRFYVDTLNFQIVERMDDVGLSGWAALARDNVELMLASPTYIPAPTEHEMVLNQVLLYVDVMMLSKLHEEIDAKEYPVGRIENRFYGNREFEVVDPEGHRIIFAEPIKNQEHEAKLAK